MLLLKLLLQLLLLLLLMHQGDGHVGGGSSRLEGSVDQRCPDQRMRSG